MASVQQGTATEIAGTAPGNRLWASVMFTPACSRQDVLSMQCAHEYDKANLLGDMCGVTHVVEHPSAVTLPRQRDRATHNACDDAGQK